MSETPDPSDLSAGMQRLETIVERMKLKEQMEQGRQRIQTSGRGISPSAAKFRPPPQPEPACAVCGDMGWLRYDVPYEHPKFGQIVPCQCIERQRTHAAATQDRAYVAELQREMGDLATSTFANFNVHRRLKPFVWNERTYTVKEQRADLQHAFDTAFEYVAGQLDPPWLHLYGPPGSGKSHLAGAVVNALRAQGERAAYASVPALIEFLRKGMQDGSADARLELLQTVPVLLMDDLGVERATGWVKERLFLIVNERWAQQRRTVFTSNESLDTIDERIADRIYQRATQIVLPVWSYRRALAEGEA